MSILSSFARQPHLDDSAITALWCAGSPAGDGPADTAARTVTAADRSGAERAGPGQPVPDSAHLAACGQCRARYDALAGWLGEVRADAIGDADEQFSGERLAAQQAQILRRLEALERPARVIAFPRIPQPAAIQRRGPQRWIAAAAAAGLIVGLGAGELIDRRGGLRTRTLGRLSSPDLTPVGQSARGNIQQVSLGSDDLLLYDTDAVSTSPRVEALQALDALTPRIRDLDQAR